MITSVHSSLQPVRLSVPEKSLINKIFLLPEPWQLPLACTPR